MAIRPLVREEGLPDDASWIPRSPRDLERAFEEMEDSGEAWTMTFDRSCSLRRAIDDAGLIPFTNESVRGRMRDLRKYEEFMGNANIFSLCALITGLCFCIAYLPNDLIVLLLFRWSPVILIVICMIPGFLLLMLLGSIGTQERSEVIKRTIRRDDEIPDDIASEIRTVVASLGARVTIVAHKVQRARKKRSIEVFFQIRYRGERYFTHHQRVSR